MNKPDVIVICGPTGIGKTASAIRVARAVGGRIVNADSMQIYRAMDIGTAKPTPEEMAEVPHVMVDVVDPDEPFDAARYAEMADGHIREFSENGIVPVVAGGTGLYIKALVSGLFRANPADPVVIGRLTREAEAIGTEALHQRLSVIDPEAAARIHPNDGFRIIRALEIHESTGKTMSEHHNGHRFGDRPYRVLKTGLAMDRAVLYDRINRRVDLMMEQGLLAEVDSLIRRGYSPELKSMGSLGYRHMAMHLSGEWSLDDAVELLKRDTRRYAKRQMTWFRADSEIEWFETGEIDRMIDRIRCFLEGHS